MALSRATSLIPELTPEEALQLIHLLIPSLTPEGLSQIRNKSNRLTSHQKKRKLDDEESNICPFPDDLPQPSIFFPLTTHHGISECGLIFREDLIPHCQDLFLTIEKVALIPESKYLSSLKLQPTKAGMPFLEGEIKSRLGASTN